jgi:hypothetical protein
VPRTAHTGTPHHLGTTVHRDREEAAIREDPQVVVETMTDATERLRDQAWMIAPLTKPAIEPAADAEPVEPGTTS